MKQALFALVALVSLTTALSAQDKPKEGSKDGAADYYPLKEGSVWEYKSGEKTIIVTLEKMEKAGEENWAKLVSKIKDDKDNKSRSEYVTVRADGVYRVQYQDQKIEVPGLRFLALPVVSPAPKEPWDIKAKMFNVTLEGNGKFAEKPETVEVPAGKYENVVVVTTTLKADKTNITITYYFARDTGLVKQVAEFNDKKVTQELVSFKSGK